MMNLDASGKAKLTPREMDILRLVVEGKTNQEIGVLLVISEKTVEKYLYAIFTKLEVTSRIEAAVYAVRANITQASGGAATTTWPVRFGLLGDEQTGYQAEIYSAGQVIARQQGEFDLLQESGDHVDRQEIKGWRATAAEKTGNRLVLTGVTHLDLFTTDLEVTVTYEKVTDRVIKKTIRLYQNNIPRLFLSLRSTFLPPQAPERYWSFDDADHPGGPAYGVLGKDVFPAVGYVLPGNRVFGLLTASGWENGWARYGFRRSASGNLPAVALVDPALLRTASGAERAAGKHAVTLTLGETYTNTRVPLQGSPAQGDYTFQARSSFSYTLVFEHPQARTLNFALRDTTGQLIFTDQALLAEEAWNIGSPEWQPYVLRLPIIENSGEHTLHITAGDRPIKTRSAQLFEVAPDPTPWHELRQGEEMVQTLFLFSEEMEPTIRNLRLTSQMRLAEGLGFQGSDIEKVLYADAQMLTWTSEPGLHEPMVVPSIYYFEMYFRDVFWILNGLPASSRDIRFLNENILRRIGETMSADGNIGNIITAYHGSIEYKTNELAYLYLIWSLRNRQRFGSPPDMERVSKVAEFVRRTFDPDGDGIVLVNNPQSSADVVWQDRPCRFAVSQGYYALVLRVINELGIAVDPAYITAAEAAYRGYYADYGTEGSFLHSFPDNRLGENGEPIGIISHVDLVPEYLSLYLFGHAMLTPKIVGDTLEKYPVTPEGLMPSYCRANGEFFTRENNPFSGGLYWKPGTYWNGGSWLRLQYMALAVGKAHGWEKAEALMQQRLDAELNYDPQNPLSREYLSTNGSPQDSAFHRVFGWNVFVLAVNEWLASWKGISQ